MFIVSKPKNGRALCHKPVLRESLLVARSVGTDTRSTQVPKRNHPRYSGDIPNRVPFVLGTRARLS